MKDIISPSLFKQKILPVLCIAVLKEACFWIWPDQILFNTILKLLAGALVVLICYGWKERPQSVEEKLILAAAGLFILADLVIKWQFLAAGALFFIGHLLLVICFWIHRKLSRKKILIWLVLTIVEAPLMILLLRQHQFSTAVGCLGVLYGAVLIMMAVCAVGQKKILMAAAFLFLFSDLFLALHKVSAALVWMHAPSILLFYVSLGMFLLGCKHENRIPE